MEEVHLFKVDAVRGWYTLNGKATPTEVQFVFSNKDSTQRGSIMMTWDDFLEFAQQVKAFKEEEEKKAADIEQSCKTLEKDMRDGCIR